MKNVQSGLNKTLFSYPIQTACALLPDLSLSYYSWQTGTRTEDMEHGQTFYSLSWSISAVSLLHVRQVRVGGNQLSNGAGPVDQGHSDHRPRIQFPKAAPGVNQKVLSSVLHLYLA